MIRDNGFSRDIVAKNCVLNKDGINDSLDVVRKNIFYMTKVKSKNNIIKNNMFKKILRE